MDTDRRGTEWIYRNGDENQLRIFAGPLEAVTAHPDNTLQTGYRRF